jgi:hypothetical protein
MIVGVEVALLCIGLYALFTGKLPASQKSEYIIQGLPARVIGLIGLLPIPLSFLVASAVAAWFVAQGKPVTRESFFWVGTAIEGSVLAMCFVAIAVMSRIYRTPVVPQAGDGPVSS